MRTLAILIAVAVMAGLAPTAPEQAKKAAKKPKAKMEITVKATGVKAGMCWNKWGLRRDSMFAIHEPGSA